ncbi:putative lipid A biosynthesis acyltransferase [Actinoplanes missouriensis 431]|uniref:Putative lipid A biosynthesis acyltransferase n=1 Tax=Actinoplanes missouriensis (strain ATCC 14538 / DSM 43046 / CBS 188.64 / JCM 3121 / NBRC 102363 / NCIMB 12654 / NRRL B-3342 / UNCC 431) TaxID=512565 RepID=I0HES2_ACTM4|nr:phosphatidylinositol mannoside acyltransferase [Actinoplanes missouriensis]BAL91509.1 putative lipid A biosynthesis acyltransferase [Actinoplanes missouriensis 431]
MKDRLTDLGYAAGWRLVRLMPEPVARTVFRAAADRAWKANGRGTQRLRENLRHVAGPDMPDTLVRDGLRSYARYWMEAFRLPGRTHRQFLDGFFMEPESYAVMKKAIAEGNGLVLALPHVANWDAAAGWVVAHGWQMITVAERLKPESVYERFLAYREGLGMRILPLTGGERPPLDVLGEHLKQGWVVPLLADRDLSRSGVEVEFFGGRARMPAGPAILAIRSGAPIYAVDLWFTEKRVEARLRPITPPGDGPLDQRVKQTTQQLADAFAAGIAEHPQDWHMLQKLWV